MIMSAGLYVIILLACISLLPVDFSEEVGNHSICSLEEAFAAFILGERKDRVCPDGDIDFRLRRHKHLQLVVELDRDFHIGKLTLYRLLNRGNLFCRHSERVRHRSEIIWGIPVGIHFLAVIRFDAI